MFYRTHESDMNSSNITEMEGAECESDVEDQSVSGSSTGESLRLSPSPVTLVHEHELNQLVAIFCPLRYCQ